jgi:hypothetical protein
MEVFGAGYCDLRELEYGSENAKGIRATSLIGCRSMISRVMAACS